MIVRIWRGRTTQAKADEYGAFLARTAHPDYSAAKGNRGWQLLRRDVDDQVEFVLVSTWDDRDALRAYAGDEYEQPHYYPEDRAALLLPAIPIEHYELVGSA